MRISDVLTGFARFVKKSTIFGARAGALIGGGFNAITYRHVETPIGEQNRKETVEDTLVELGSYAYNIGDGAVEGIKGGACLGLAVGLTPVLAPTCLTFMAYYNHNNRKTHDAIEEICSALEQTENQQDSDNPRRPANHQRKGGK